MFFIMIGVVIFLLSAFFLVLFMGQCLAHNPNFTLLAFALFLIFGGIGNHDKSANYRRINFSCKDVLRRGVEIKRVAISSACPLKNALRFLSRGNYLVLEVYDEQEKHLFDLSQNELSALFLSAKNPYTPLSKFYNPVKSEEKR